MGNFTEIFLGNQENFRGCMDDVIYNGVNVLSKAREAQMLGYSRSLNSVATVSEGVTWECSKEFDAGMDDPISFLKEDSYISFPNWIPRTGAMVTFRVRTTLFCTDLIQFRSRYNSQLFMALTG